MCAKEAGGCANGVVAGDTVAGVGAPGFAGCAGDFAGLGVGVAAAGFLPCFASAVWGGGVFFLGTAAGRTTGTASS